MAMRSSSKIFLRFPDHLGLLLIVAGLGIDRGVVVEDVERIGVRQNLRPIDLAFEAGARRFHQFLHGGSTRAARRLIGRDDQALDAVLPMDRPQRHQRGDRRAIRYGNDALVLTDAARVDLRDHQRHVRVHAEGGGIVDDDGAGLGGDRRIFPGNAAAGGEQRDVDAVERIRSQFLNGDGLATKAKRLARRTGARQRFQPADREPALVHGGDEFGTDGAGHAGNGNNRIVLHFHLHQKGTRQNTRPIKKPRTFSGGASV